MKKNIKKFIPTILAITMLSSTGVFANGNLISPNPMETKKEEMQKDNSKKMLVVKLMEKDSQKFFPAREVFEKLGFEIEYEPVNKMVTATKLPLYITFSSKEDAYTFSKMAPQKLGHAPIVIDGKTYVPITLLTEIMGMEDISVEDLTLKIMLENDEEMEMPELKQTIITDIDKDAKTITVEDYEKGEVVLNIKNLKIDYTTEDKELMIGQAVEVVYGDEMMASEPPMNNPKSLKVVTKYNIVKVLNMETDENGNKMILVEDKDLGEVLLLVSKDTKMPKDIKIEKGQYLKVAMSDAMTLSLPPQTVAKEIELYNMEMSKEDMNKAEMKEVTVVSVDKENKEIIVEDKDLGKVALNIDKDVMIEIENKDKKSEDIFNLVKKGDKIKVIFGDMMTKSLPPMNTPVKIMISK